jgi:hypothetical protein
MKRYLPLLLLLPAIALAAFYPLFGPVTGILKGSATSPQTSAAVASDVVALFSTCSGTQYLGADGACHTPSGGGTPGGSSGDVQYNGSGSFAGATTIGSTFTYTPSNGSVAITALSASSTESLVLTAPGSNVNALKIASANNFAGVNFSETSGGQSGRVALLGATGNGPCNGGATADLCVASGNGGIFFSASGSPMYLSSSGAVALNSPTGGALSAGKINVSGGYYVNGVAVGGGGPGGSSGAVQYNNSSAFGGANINYKGAIGGAYPGFQQQGGGYFILEGTTGTNGVYLYGYDYDVNTTTGAHVWVGAASGGPGGEADVVAGNASAGIYNGGLVHLVGGNAGGSAAQGGDIQLTPGTGGSTRPGAVLMDIAPTATGTIFTIASGTGACATTSTKLGGSWAGSFVCTGTTGASTVTLTLSKTNNSYNCAGMRDITNPTTITQTNAVSTSSVTFTMTSVTANDVIEFHCVGY